MENPYYEFAHSRLPQFCKNHPLRLFPTNKSEKLCEWIKTKHRSFGGDLKLGLDSFLNAVEQFIA